ADDCAACHMPRGDTEIPHIAFTHHRIGIHTAQPTAEPGRVPALVPIEDVSRQSPLDQQRNLGLAYLEVARNALYPQFSEPYRARARQLLEEVHEAGLPDGQTSSALAELYWEGSDSVRAAGCAREALEAKDLPVRERAGVLLLLAHLERQYHNYESAVTLLEE